MHTPPCLIIVSCTLMIASTQREGKLNSTDRLTHSLSQSLTRSLTHLLTRSHTHSLSRSLARSLNHALNPTHSLSHSHPLTLSLTHSLPLTHSLLSVNFFEIETKWKRQLRCHHPSPGETNIRVGGVGSVSHRKCLDYYYY